MRALAVAVILAGCASNGRAIRSWTIAMDGAPTQVSVTLPDALLAEVPLHYAAITLYAQVPLRAEEWSRTLTFVVPCFHGPLRVTVNGSELNDIGETMVGEHRYIIRAPHADALAIEMSARIDPTSAGFGFGGAPRLSTGARVTATPAATFDVVSTIAEGVCCLVLAVLFAALYAMDRQRRSDGAFAVQVIAGLGIPAWGLGLISGPVFLSTYLVSGAAGLYFVHFELDDGRRPRWLVNAHLISAALGWTGIWSRGLFAGWQVVVTVLGLLWIGHVLRVLWHPVRHGPRPGDARILFVTVLVANALAVPTVLQALGIPLIPGAHLESLAPEVWAIGQALVLARQHVARRREAELANTELQRQVAERSKDLADALARLVQQRRAGTDERTIDNRYRVLRRIGAGGMGEVYEVERATDQRRFALKTVRGAARPDALARLAREAHIAAAITHPNLVPVLDVGIADGELFVVMPLVAGGSLEAQRANFGDPAWARPKLAQIAAGIAMLHERGIVHRDLKPSNILLEAGVARIADFGLAVMSEPPPDALGSTLSATARDLTGAGDVFGTPAYMAPELADGVRDPAPSSDVFAFGVIACELLTGRAPFGEPPLRAKLAGRAIPAPMIDGVDPLIARCLELDPGLRPTAAELAASLR